jgi:hypothetical protein
MFQSREWIHICKASSFHSESNRVLEAYSTPSDEKVRKVVLDLKHAMEKTYTEIFQDKRAPFQTAISNNLVRRPESFSKLICDHYGKDEDSIYDYASGIYEQASGKELNPENLRLVLSKVPELQLTLLGYAYSLYARLIQDERYGNKRQAGAIDTWTAIYLPHCDYLVTHDNQQLEALSQINAFNPTITEVLSYETFRSRLLL